ncbi:MAG: thioredoxin [Chlamydiae bacterium RIFCSPHIGHO2_12_FULL_49_11]|nr:MAG: thioredoxin [Chlamydiae bacterium RIFCSPHIGHO2_12_FULL_49_11]
MAGEIAETDEKRFPDLSKSEKNLVVEVYAPWCGPCKMLAPIMEAIAVQFDGKCTFVKLNGDVNDKLIEAWHIRGYPTLLFFKNGKEVGREVGFTRKEKLVEVIGKYFLTD